MSTENKLLEIRNIHTSFRVQKMDLEAVRGVSFHVNEGEFFAIVGESGSGKSVLMKSIMGILPNNAKVSSDGMIFAGKNLDGLTEEEYRRLRGSEMAMIFQDPMTALNPVKKIGAHLIEVIRRHQKVTKHEAEKIAVEALKKVGIPSPESRMQQYPHEFSGGMRQRVMIAMALCCSPKLLIADEPTTALDVTIQAQILDLLKELQEKEQMSVVLITHDLGVVSSTCSRIIVMYGGRIMEEGLSEDIFYHPRHPYTRALLRAVPKPVTGKKERLEAIPGATPSLTELPVGCPFQTRCVYACSRCEAKEIPRQDYSSTQYAFCVFRGEELDEMGKRKTGGKTDGRVE